MLNLVARYMKGMQKRLCQVCGGIARSHCPFKACKKCCVQADNRCTIHGENPFVDLLFPSHGLVIEMVVFTNQRFSCCQLTVDGIPAVLKTREQQIKAGIDPSRVPLTPAQIRQRKASSRGSLLSSIPPLLPRLAPPLRTLLQQNVHSASGGSRG